VFLVFRPVTDKDSSLLCTWFADSAFVTWWGGTPKTPAEVREECMSRYDPARGDQLRSFIVEHRGEPVGYIQAWNDDREIVGIDIVLTPGRQNRGIGTEAVRCFAERLKAEGWHDIGLDPAIENSRAIRAFEKAGFTRTGRPIEPGHVWMAFDPAGAPS